MRSVKRALRSLFLIGLCLEFPGPILAEAPIVEANNDFTFKGRLIRPGLVREFQNWLSDYRPPITVMVDVGAAYGTNEYAEAPVPGKDGRVSVTLGDGGERFLYKRLGRSGNGLHVLHTADKSAGTGIFQSVVFVRFHMAQGFDRDGIEPSERLLMSVVGVYAPVGPNPPISRSGQPGPRQKRRPSHPVGV